VIEYQQEPELSTDEFISVLKASGLAERRPVDDILRIEKMLTGANLIVTARENGKLIGVARSITDFVYCTYLSDLAVDEQFQYQGIGKHLIKLTKQTSEQATLILLSAPAATGYYPKIGMKRHEHCFLIRDENEIL